MGLLIRILRRQWPALIVVLLMGGISALLGYELYGRWRYAETVRHSSDCGTWKTFRLSDGRRMSYRETGSPAGPPTFYFHGAVGSSEEWPVAENHGLRLIAPDRPGYGCSTPQPGRTLEAWAGDVREMADQLGWKQFDVIGFSAGVSHALATAIFLPERVRTVKLIATARAAPFSGMRAAVPGITFEIFTAMRKTWERDPDGFEVQASRDLPPPDKALYLRPDILTRFKATHARSLHASVAGVYEDIRLIGKPWNLDLSKVKAPVHIWHGDQDKVAPLTSVEPLYRSIPRAQITRISGEGHFLYYDHEQEILAPF